MRPESRNYCLWVIHTSVDNSYRWCELERQANGDWKLTTWKNGETHVDTKTFERDEFVDDFSAREFATRLMASLDIPERKRPVS